MEGYQIVPYARVDGVPTFKNSEMFSIYEQLCKEGLDEILFHDGSINNEIDFMTKIVTNPKTLFYIIMDTRVNLPAAIFWVNRIESTHCYCHFCAFTGWWGSGDTVKLGREAMRCLFRMEIDGEPMFYTIMGMIPESNTFARDYLHKVGLHDVGKVPNFLWSKKENGPVDGFAMYITREDLDNEDLH